LLDFNSTWYSADFGADTIVIDTAAGGTGAAPAGEVLLLFHFLLQLLSVAASVV
jgi:hypothetical protein